LRKEIEFISKQVSTLTEDLLKRKKIEEAKDKECVVVENNSGWWW
jgi:AmiR/NasT family two-component response regulator